MAITDKEKGVWGLDQVYNKINQGSIWEYSAPVNLWGVGRQADGALGLNHAGPGVPAYYSSPVQLPGTNWAIGSQIDPSMAGDEGQVAIKTDGTLWAWGKNNTYGQLGVNNRTNYSSPTQVGTGTDWKSLNTLPGGNGGIKTDGTLWMWGFNNIGELAQNNRTNYSSPVQVPGTTWSSCGNNGSGSIASKTDGTLWVWGSNSYGELGQNGPHNVHKSSPVQIPGTTWGRSTSNCASNVTAIKTDGTLWAWGKNLRGQVDGVQGTTNYYSSPVQVGSDTTWEKVVSFISGWMAIKTDGTLWGVGSDYYGELGQNTNGTYRSSPVQIPGTNWNSIRMQNYSGVATKTDGTAWGWGENSSYGQIGVNDRADRSSPVQLPGTWNMAYTSGYNNFYLTQQ